MAMNRPQIDVTKIYLLNKCSKFVSCWGFGLVTSSTRTGISFAIAFSGINLSISQLLKKQLRLAIATLHT